MQKTSDNVKIIDHTLSAIKGGYLGLTTVVETAQKLMNIFNCKPEEKDQVATLVENKLKAMLVDDNSFISASKDLGSLKLYRDTNERTKIIWYTLRDRNIIAREAHFLDSPKDTKAMQNMDKEMEKYRREQRKRYSRPDGRRYKKTA